LEGEKTLLPTVRNETCLFCNFIKEKIFVRNKDICQFAFFLKTSTNPKTN